LTGGTSGGEKKNTRPPGRPRGKCSVRKKFKGKVKFPSKKGEVRSNGKKKHHGPFTYEKARRRKKKKTGGGGSPRENKKETKGGNRIPAGKRTNIT